MGFDFSLVDVFTDRPFGGNRLAVFPDATGIADATMQQLAWEFNFSETTAAERSVLHLPGPGSGVLSTVQ
jgi:PhzF family phenazine biosynthesis protein